MPEPGDSFLSPEGLKTDNQRSLLKQPDSIDKAIGKLLLEMVGPMTLEIAWAVQQELQSCLDQAGQLRKQQVERARYQAGLAMNRYMQVEPNNRLVADELEADWNAKLRVLTDAQQ